MPTPKKVTILIAGCFVIALGLRVAPQLKNVYINGETRFAGADSYYHMRLVDNLLLNYPDRIRFDPYLAWPDGISEMRVRAWPPLLDWLLGAIILIICGSAPMRQYAELVAAAVPPLLGALTVIPVYFTGKRIAGKSSGLIAAALVAIIPGEFLGRSLLGFTDHHVLETLLSTCAALFMIKALQHAHDADSGVPRLIIASLLSGFFLGLYLLTWLGAIIFFATASAYITIEALLDNRRESFLPNPYGATALVLGTAFCMARFVLPEDYGGGVYWALLACSALWPIMLTILLRATRPMLHGKKIFAAMTVALCLFFLLVLKKNTTAWAMLQADINAMLDLHEGILEAQPLMSGRGIQRLVKAWQGLGICFFTAPFGLVLLGRRALNRNACEKRWFFVWCIALLVLTLTARRFAYYYAINAALLTAPALQWLTARATLLKPDCPPRIKQAFITGAFILVILPDFLQSVKQAGRGDFIPNEDWLQALSWLRENTPEPFPDPAFYYRHYEPPPPGRPFDYPYSAYGIMTWWDYGHWIVREGRRIPVSTPFQWGRERAARFFVSGTSADAGWMMNATKSRYVIVDKEMITGKFHYMALAARAQPETFYEELGLLLEDGGFEQVVVFYPEYYRSMAVRLYAFNGMAVVPDETPVIKILDHGQNDRGKGRLIEKTIVFPDFEQALDFVASQKHDQYRIAGFSPFKTPAPINALKEYRQEWNSSSNEVKIFKFIPNSTD